MARRRWWLAVLSLISLVVLVYAGVLTAFSVSVTSAIESANRLPGAPGPIAGERALVVPLAEASQVPTLYNQGEPTLDRNGTLLVLAQPGATFPAGASNVSIARALAYVTPTANGSYVPPHLELTGVPYADGNETREENVTLDVMALAGGKTGFLVKGDAERNVSFVPTDRIVGAVARFEEGSSLLPLYIVGGVGFVAPLVSLILTHRPTGTRGIGATGTAGLCPECRAPIAKDSDFCTRCGAWSDPSRRQAP